MAISSIAVPHVHRDSLFHHAFHHRPAGEFALMPEPPAPAPSPLLVSVRLLLKYGFPYSSLILCRVAFLCFLQDAVLDLPSPWVGVLESSGSVSGTELPQLLLTKATPLVPHFQDLSNNTIKLNKMIFQWSREITSGNYISEPFYRVSV